MSLRFICPNDNNILNEYKNFYECTTCNDKYFIKDGVLCLLNYNDIFYEGAYKNQVNYLPKSEKFWDIWPLWLINCGYIWQVRKEVPKDSAVLELGCASGVRYFGKRYEMIGCDLSFSSLKNLDFYAKRIQANAIDCIPLEDSSIDAVVSSFLWEHLKEKEKIKLLEECKRVLKPAGKIIFLYDVTTKNPLINYYKTNQPLLYKELFLDGDSHLGYQLPEENLHIFKQSGLKLNKHIGLEKTFFMGTSVYHKLAKFQYGKYFKFFKKTDNGFGFYVWSFIVRCIDTLISPLLPISWSRIVIVSLSKSIK